MPVSFVDERAEPPLSEDFDVAELRRLAAETLRAERLPAVTEVTIALLDREPMAALNEAHMGKEGATDVLAFPLEDLAPGEIPTVSDAGPPLNIGDVFICTAVVADNAATSGVPLPDEMALMVVHGLLHLLGYDHVVDSEAEQMEQRERELMAAVGLVRP